MDERGTLPDRHVSKEIRPEEAMLYCPVCNNRLSERKCKLACARGGYCMSCADYY